MGLVIANVQTYKSPNLSMNEHTNLHFTIDQSTSPYNLISDPNPKMQTIVANLAILVVLLGVVAKSQAFYIYVPDEMIERHHVSRSRRAAFGGDGWNNPDVRQGQMLDNRVGPTTTQELPGGGFQRNLNTQTDWIGQGGPNHRNVLNIDLFALPPALGLGGPK